MRPQPRRHRHDRCGRTSLRLGRLGRLERRRRVGRAARAAPRQRVGEAAGCRRPPARVPRRARVRCRHGLSGGSPRQPQTDVSRPRSRKKKRRSRRRRGRRRRPPGRFPTAAPCCRPIAKRRRSGKAKTPSCVFGGGSVRFHSVRRAQKPHASARRLLSGPRVCAPHAHGTRPPARSSALAPLQGLAGVSPRGTPGLLARLQVVSGRRDAISVAPVGHPIAVGALWRRRRLFDASRFGGAPRPSSASLALDADAALGLARERRSGRTARGPAAAAGRAAPASASAPADGHRARHQKRPSEERGEPRERRPPLERPERRPRNGRARIHHSEHSEQRAGGRSKQREKERLDGRRLRVPQSALSSLHARLAIRSRRGRIRNGRDGLLISAIRSDAVSVSCVRPALFNALNDILFS